MKRRWSNTRKKSGRFIFFVSIHLFIYLYILFYLDIYLFLLLKGVVVAAAAGTAAWLLNEEMTRDLKAK